MEALTEGTESALKKRFTNSFLPRAFSVSTQAPTTSSTWRCSNPECHNDLPIAFAAVSSGSCAVLLSENIHAVVSA